MLQRAKYTWFPGSPNLERTRPTKSHAPTSHHSPRRCDGVRSWRQKTRSEQPPTGHSLDVPSRLRETTDHNYCRHVAILSHIPHARRLPLSTGIRCQLSTSRPPAAAQHGSSQRSNLTNDVRRNQTPIRHARIWSTQLAVGRAVRLEKLQLLRPFTVACVALVN